MQKTEQSKRMGKAESNQKWAKDAQVWIISLSAKNFRKQGKGENLWANYDIGAANYGLMLQAAFMNWMAHQMGGFDRDKIVKEFNILSDSGWLRRRGCWNK